MSKPTIDGVPRDLIKRMVDCAKAHADISDEDLVILCSLLNKPVKPTGYISDTGLARLRAGRHASLTRARTNRMTNALYLDPECASPRCPNCDGGTLQADGYRYKCTQCEFECGEGEDE